MGIEWAPRKRAPTYQITPETVGFSDVPVMNAWRTSHAFPLNTIQMSLRRASEKIDEAPTVVQRLKRAPTVVSKLRRFPTMQLSRMQDLGGCRSILGSIANVRRVQDHYNKSRQRHELATEKDYIEEPQDSGYRGVHLIFRYQSDRTEEFNGHRIEVQLRTRVQHAWATAVEIAGIYVRTPLKSSIGPEDWLDFFRFSSSIFSSIENSPKLHKEATPAEIIACIRRLDARIGAREKLRNFTAAHKYIAGSRLKSHTHFILTLNLEERRTDVGAFSSLKSASERYEELEKAHIDNELVDVVMVSAESIDSVAVAYPNYFADTSSFLSMLSDAIK